MAEIPTLVDGHGDARRTVVLAHGAGAPMDSPFMRRFAEGLAAEGLRVVRFEFPYMQERRRTGGRRGPDRAPVLEESWRQVVAQTGPAERQIIGGKSMGGRIASRIADACGVAGLVCLGYPFHPPGRPETLRTEHLSGLTTPTLIVQGTRDPFGRHEEVAEYDLSPTIELCWIEDGDHSLKPRRRSGLTEEQNLQQAIDRVAAFAGETLG